MQKKNDISNEELTIYTAKELQEIFHISKPSAYALMHSAGFPSFAINNRYYVEKKELEKWIRLYTGKKYQY